MLNLKSILLLSIISFSFLNFVSLENKPKFSKTQVFVNDTLTDQIELSFGMDTLAEFPGGQLGWRNYIFKNLRYPINAQKANQTGKVYINFIVLKSGEITNIVVSKNASRSLANEVTTLIKKMPKWKPAILNGQPVNSSISMPFTFINLGVIN